MVFKHTGRSVLSIPMGISIGIHFLLVAGLIFLSWEKPAPKTEIPPIKISYISLEQKKEVIPKETKKPIKENPNPLKTSQPFRTTLHHASKIIKKVSLPVKPSPQTPNNISTNFQIQPAKMIANTVQRFSPNSRQKARSQSAISKLGKPLTPIFASISTYTKYSFSSPNLHKKVIARTITEELNSYPIKTSPAPSLQLLERWIPVSKSHPVQIASIPSDFVDEVSKSTSLASVAEKPGRSSGETDSSGQNLDAIRKGFSTSVWGKIAQAKYYPSMARKRGWEGKPIIEFKLARNGDLLSSAITLNSPYKILNEAALDAIKNAAPYPEIPDTLKVDSIRFKLPISFILNEP